MDALDEFPGTYFKGADLVGKRMGLTVTGAGKETMSDGRTKLVLSFKEDDRRLVLNTGNRLTLVDRYGRNTDGWVGKKLTLIAQRVQGPSGPCHGIRLADAPVGDVIDDEQPEAEEPKKKRAFK
jgi:hypothetical protein